MHILSVIAHPSSASFCHAVLERFATGTKDAGHSHEIADLHKEQFSPVMTARDLQQFEGVSMPDDVKNEQRRVERSDALCLIFPTWWYQMPAMMKGWLDRVWSAGWAYEWEHDPEGSLLKPRPCVMLIPTGVSEVMEAEWQCVKSIEHVYRKGVLGYCGVDPVNIHFMLDAAAFDKGVHQKHLETAYQAGKNIVCASRILINTPSAK
jgi:NAD(P)H dehydrogenase (quinone)